MKYTFIAGRDTGINLRAAVADCIRAIMRLLSNRWSPLLQRLAVLKGMSKSMLVNVLYVR
jgi:hypothetical protein